jgi:retrograde regulation protein 2
MFDIDSRQLYGICDMGSNGIRFSITDLSPLTARSLPTVFMDRLGLSLFDAQYSTGEKGPIPQSVIDEVLAALMKFKTTCADFDVPEANIRILATEATRTAVNSEDYRRQIKDATGWEVDMLPKEAEGKIGAMGVASSFSEVDGLVMDLGGGSTQITWMQSKNGNVTVSPQGSFSFPYGAAALTRKLAEIAKSPNPQQETTDLQNTMKAQFQEAYTKLDLPPDMLAKAKSGTLPLHLSGGGFRGWGYLLMSQHKVSPYPIPIINGFQVHKHEFHSTENITTAAANASTHPIFRISSRRAAQVPAVAFLISILTTALPDIETIRFCQGGVREGYLFSQLPQQIRTLDPLPSATAPYARPSADLIAKLLLLSLPPNTNPLGRFLPSSIHNPSVPHALANLLYLHSPHSKESAPLSALHFPITGPLASAHGISHVDRASLSIALYTRWSDSFDSSSLPPPHNTLLTQIQSLLSPQETFWATYLGVIAKFIADIYPAGIISKKNPRILDIDAEWKGGLGKKGLDEGVKVTVLLRKEQGMGMGLTDGESFREAVKRVEGVGKKKNRVGGKEGSGYGVPVKVSVNWE